jgi:hypothetical protein
MRRTAMMLIICAALATPMVAYPGDQAMPPEAQWTPTPAPQSTTDAHRLASTLVEKGMMPPHEALQLTQPQAMVPSPRSVARAWTWDEIDQLTVRSSAGD